ncbi:MAG: alpha/beta fold hydrolase [Planctomycetes bacterium]|nr:alpha/beta fold hydrolase [Planctomycetota bacterium]
MPTLDAGGVRHHYQDRGEGPPVLLLHCWTGNHSLWADPVEGLAGRFRCIAPDFRGHGQTAGGGELSPRALASDVLALADALGLHAGGVGPALVGHSLGGMVALELALARPEAFPRLALISSSACLGQLALSRHAARVADRLLATGRVPAFLKGWVVSLGLVHPSAPTEVRRRIREAILAVPDPVARSCLRGLRHLDLRGRLSEVRAPTLVVVGRQDLCAGPRHSRLLAAGISGARLEVLEACGHFPMLERPEALLRLLADFLGPLARTRRPSQRKRPPSARRA